MGLARASWKVFFVLSSSVLLWSVVSVVQLDHALTGPGAGARGGSCDEPGLYPGSQRRRVKKDDSPAPQTTTTSNSTTQSLQAVMEDIESSLLFHCSNRRPLAVAKDISYGRYYAQRDIQGWDIAYTNASFEFVEQSFRTQVKLSDLSAFLCLGIQSQDKHCLHPSSYVSLRNTQRYNQFYAIRDILWRKDGFCYTIREALSGYRGRKNFTFPCWVLPKDRSSLEREMNKTGLSPWIVKPSGQGEGHGIFVANRFSEILERHSSMDNFVVQPLLTDPYLVEGKKFDFRTYVLVTSMLPLRAYIYKEGLVRFAASKYNRSASRGGSERQYLTNTSVGKKYAHLSNLTWTFRKLKGYLAGHGVDPGAVFERINDAIVRTLLSAEYRFQRSFFLGIGGYDCHSCFQLLGVDVILDSDLHPYVIEVNGLPSMQLSHDLGVPPDPTNPYTITKFGLTHDMLQILFKPTPVSADLTRHLERLRVGLRPGPLCNPRRHITCVDYKDLQKLLDSGREYVNRGGYQRIYPSKDGEKYSGLIQRMDSLIERKFTEAEMPAPRTLWHVHHLYTALEKLYQ